MRTMKRITFIIAAAAAVLAGCSEFQDIPDKPSSYTLKGTVAPLNPQTRVAAKDITADEVGFEWEAGDTVAYLTGTEDELVLVMAVCTDPENGIFEISDPAGLEEGKEYGVMYPFPDEYLLPVTFEERREGNVARKHIVSGSGTLSGFCLDGHMPVVHLSLKGSGKIGRIELKVLPDSGDEEMQEFGTVQTCGADGATLGSEPTDFYVSLNCVETVEDVESFNVKIYDTDNNLLFNKNASAVLEEENKIIDMPVVEIQG